MRNYISCSMHFLIWVCMLGDISPTELLDAILSLLQFNPKASASVRGGVLEKVRRGERRSVRDEPYLQSTGCSLVRVEEGRCGVGAVVSI